MTSVDPQPGVTRRRPPVSREFVERHRRQRFVAAACELAHEFGLAEVKTRTICQLAGTARNTFYEVFPNVAACLSYGLEEAAERLYAPLREPPGTPWLPAFAATVARFYEGLAEEPLLAELLLVHSFAIDCGREWERHHQGVELLAALLAGGREAAPPARRAQLPAISEELYACVYLAAASEALREDRAECLVARVEPLALLVGELFLTPFARRRRGQRLICEKGAEASIKPLLHSP